MSKRVQSSSLNILRWKIELRWKSHKINQLNFQDDVNQTNLSIRVS